MCPTIPQDIRKEACDNMDRVETADAIWMVALTLALSGLFLDNVNLDAQSWNITYMVIVLELSAVLLVVAGAYVRWPNSLTIVMGLCFFVMASMFMMVEIVNLQPLFTREFLVGALIFCVALPIIVLLLLWGFKKR